MAALTPAVAADSPYTIQQHWPVAAAGKWDFAALDSVRHHLFLTQDERVYVLDQPSGKLIAAIPAHGAHGVAFAQDLGLGFISNGKSNTVTAFDLDNLQVKQDIAIPGSNPDVILYEPMSHKLYSFNGKSADISVIDATQLKVLSTFAAGGKPEFAVSNAAGRVFFNLEDQAKIGVIDVVSDKIVATWALKGCTEPSGLALDQSHQRLFSVCQNKVMITSSALDGKFIARSAIGEHPDAVIYDATRGNILSSNGGGGGSLSVIHQQDADHYRASGTTPTASGAKTMAMDVAANTVYLPTLIDGQFSVLVLGQK
jgi:YVTN family beta-propeller protein